LFGIFEILDESTYFKTLLDAGNANFYRVNSYKLYLEYGLTEKLTVGGYLKNYNFYSRYTHEDTKLTKKLDNDYYSNLFLIQNLYWKNNNLFSLQYSTYFPIKYEELSKEVNIIDTRFALELSMLYGRSGEIDSNLFDISAKYYTNLSLAYKFVNDINYDEITFGAAFGINLNDSSTFGLYYEYQYYLNENLFDKESNIYNYYDGYNTNQFKISFTYKFLDNLSTEFSYYRKFSKINSTGLVFSFIFGL